MLNNSHLTLEDLEQKRWGDPEFGSHLVTELHRLRKVPIGQFTIENLRIVIGQGESLPHLLPLALEKLYDNPFAEGDFFPGDLLRAVLRIKWEFWSDHPALFSELQSVMDNLERRMTTANDELLPAWQAYFK